MLPDDPLSKNLEPNAGVAVLSSPKKSKHEGDMCVVDILAKEKRIHQTQHGMI
jgi:hypothetical protein